MRVDRVTSAVRVDDRIGIREEAEFFGRSELLFGFRHLPRGEPTSCVVVCSPLIADFRKNYRREVLLGRALAADGIAVQRFHYRGTAGHSDGDPTAVTFETLTRDASDAAARVTEVTGAPLRAFVGTRLGALVAARAVGSYEDAALALWEPITNVDAYYREGFRARQIRDLREQAATSGSAKNLARELELQGRVDVLGFTVWHRLYESVRHHSLEHGLSRSGAAVLLVQIGASQELRREYDELLRGLRSAGRSVEARVVRAGTSWWLSEADGNDVIQNDGSPEVVEVTRRWIKERSSEAGVR
jgi:alpha/beta superfamily hydrolase